MLYSIKKDKEYKKIVKDIFRNTEFKQLYNIEHHGISRMEHSIKISYYSYKIAKKLGMDYVSVARGGLLHDFFLDGDERNGKRKFLDTFTHPKKALNTSMEHFEINSIEQNIIVSHMFPLGNKFPKYKESLLVDIVDDYIAIYEAVYAKKKELGAACTFLCVFMLNLIFRW